MNIRLTLDQFIVRAQKIHNFKYKYERVKYINLKTKIEIVCPEHGAFWQTPGNHLQGRTCPKCGKIRRLKQTKYNTSKFIEKVKLKHGDKYDYSMVEYVHSKMKVDIICKEHGLFSQLANKHIMGVGCPLCGQHSANCRNTKTCSEFIDKAKTIHGDKYDYSLVNYKGVLQSVKIRCTKHGIFLQKAHNHLQGSGCPKCKNSKLETKVRLLLENNNIKFETEKMFKWLGQQRLDFYLPDYQLAIECQGRQHYVPVEQFGGEERYQQTIKADFLKRELCDVNQIKLVYFSDCYKAPKGTFKTTNKLLSFIKEYGGE